MIPFSIRIDSIDSLLQSLVKEEESRERLVLIHIDTSALPQEVKMNKVLNVAINELIREADGHCLRFSGLVSDGRWIGREVCGTCYAETNQGRLWWKEHPPG